MSRAHIADLITAATPTRPDDYELRVRIDNAMQALRWPEDGEDVSSIHRQALLALHVLYNRLVVAQSNEALYRAKCRMLSDSFDEQGDEIERLRKELGR